jgi:cytochrome c biogenesis protein CcmG/thiol:disulfide interchange protein DsbE
MKKIIFAIVLLLTGSLLLAEPMTDFNLTDVNNKEVKLSDLLGKGPVLFDFWATWCVPCKKAMPALNKLAEKYDSLSVVVISIDAPKDVPKAKAFLKSNDYKFIGLFDSEKKLANKLNVVNPPRTIIVDKAGEIVLSHDGYEPGTEKIYEAKIRELLNLPAEELKVDEIKTDGNTECGTCPAGEVKPAVPETPKTDSCGGCK